jgi:anti-sigma factor RsiW
VVPEQAEPLANVIEDVAKQAARPWPVEFKSPDPNKAAQWLRDKVDFRVPSPKLKLANASLEGTRLSHAGAHPAAQWAYKVDGHPVTMMIFNTLGKAFTGGQSIDLDGRKVLTGRKNGYNLAIVFNGDMACALASDLPQERLLKLVLDFCKSW